MKCTDCGRETCPTLAIHPQEYVDELKAERDCLRAQIAAANKRADREAEARDEDMRAAHGRFEALSAALATERAAREKAEMDRAAAYVTADRLHRRAQAAEERARVARNGVAREIRRSVSLARIDRELRREAATVASEAVKRADAMAARLAMAKNYDAGDGCTIDRHGRGFTVSRWNPRTRDSEYLNGAGAWIDHERDCTEPHVFPAADAAFAALDAARGLGQ